MNTPLPPRALPRHPNLEQLKRQAKELLRAHSAAEGNTFALHDAQRLLARSYGFDSWPKLKAFVDGVNVRRFDHAARENNLAEVRRLLRARPELARLGGSLLYAVLNRNAALVELLLQHGAHARDGVYPHREATSPLAIATERGYTEIVELIHRQLQPAAPAAAPGAVDAFFQALRAGQSATVLELLQTNPDLCTTSHPQAGLTALHIAARRLDVPLVRALLGLGANPTVTCRKNNTPLDWAAHSAGIESRQEFEQIAALLQAQGAQQTAAGAAASGDVPWLTARHQEGTLENRILDTGGLLRIAVSCHHRPVLELLLGFGWDPNERARFGDPEGDEPEYTQGMPLYRCAGTGNYEYAELLLNHGANPNASVYASGDPVFQAFSRRDWPMVELLARHGGIPCASTAGLYRQTALGLRMLSGEAPYRLERPHGLAEELLWGAACGGDVELVRQSLERIDWPKNDPRWFDLLEQPLRVWDHGGNNGDRSTYPACFALLLERIDPNLPGRQEERGFGLTLLHSVAGSREHLTPEERRTFATLLLEAGANLTVRDNLLKSTPLGWACRWGRPELVELLLHHGADPLEPTADPWATPRAWATRKNHPGILALLDSWIDGGAPNGPPGQ